MPARLSSREQAREGACPTNKALKTKVNNARKEENIQCVNNWGSHGKTLVAVQSAFEI